MIMVGEWMGTHMRISRARASGPAVPIGSCSAEQVILIPSSGWASKYDPAQTISKHCCTFLILILEGVHDMCSVPDSQHDFVNTSSSQCFNLMIQLRLVTNLDNWFGFGECQWSKTSAKASNKNESLHRTKTTECSVTSRKTTKYFDPRLTSLSLETGGTCAIH